MLVCVSFVHLAHETAGAARTRSSLRPLFSEEHETAKPWARLCRGKVESCVEAVEKKKKPRPGGKPGGAFCPVVLAHIRLHGARTNRSGDLGAGLTRPPERCDASAARPARSNRSPRCSGRG